MEPQTASSPHLADGEIEAQRVNLPKGIQRKLLQLGLGLRQYDSRTKILSRFAIHTAQGTIYLDHPLHINLDSCVSETEKEIV